MVACLLPVSMPNSEQLSFLHSRKVGIVYKEAAFKPTQVENGMLLPSSESRNRVITGVLLELRHTHELSSASDALEFELTV